MTISDRLKDAPQYATIPDTNAGPKCEPWNAQAEIAALKAKLADHSSSLVDIVAAHSKRIEADEARIENVEAVIKALDERIAKTERMAEELNKYRYTTATHLKSDEQRLNYHGDRFDEIDKRISDLADRLSVVHVQAQGDAKIRAQQETAYGTAQPVMHWPDLEGVDANRMRSSVIDDCLKQGEKRIRLDELGIIAKRLDGRMMPWIAQRLGYQPIPVGETLMNEIEKRRREIEEGT